MDQKQKALIIILFGVLLIGISFSVPQTQSSIINNTYTSPSSASDLSQFDWTGGNVALVNSPTHSAGYSIECTGTYSFVALQDTSNSPKAFSEWIYLPSIPSSGSGQGLIALYDNTYGDLASITVFNNAGTCYFDLTSSLPSPASVNIPYNLQSNTWYQVQIQFTSSGLSAWITTQNTFSSTPTLTYSVDLSSYAANTVEFGANWASSGTLYIAEVAVNPATIIVSPTIVPPTVTPTPIVTPTPTKAPTTVTLTFNIVNTNNQPVSGAIVTLDGVGSAPTTSCTTNSNGVATINVPSGIYNCYATSGKLTSYNSPVTADGSMTINLVIKSSATPTPIINPLYLQIAGAMSVIAGGFIYINKKPLKI